MQNNQITIDDFLYESHIGLERQGPGSTEITLKALSFIKYPEKISNAIDFGCGTGGQTMVLAQKIHGTIFGMDLSPEFIDVFNNNAKKLNLHNRVKGIVGSMDNLSFQKEEFDLVWSEGAIDAIGFEKGLNYWNGFLKKDGYIAVSCPSWLSAERSGEVEKFWADAGSNLDGIEHNISVMQKSGYGFIAAFTLPNECWTDNYFIPREKAGKAILEKHSGNKDIVSFMEADNYEFELFKKYNQYYGYVFYIGRKM